MLGSAPAKPWRSSVFRIPRQRDRFTWGDLDGFPKPPMFGSAPAKPWRCSVSSAEEFRELAEGVGVGAAEELEDDGLGRGDDGAGLARLRETDVHVGGPAGADGVGDD